MSDLFKDVLKDSESLFKNEVALDPEFTPKSIPFRENENQYIATCIKPLFQKRTGKNLIVHGTPGIGKTLAVKNVLKELEEETDEIITVYANCWKKNSTYQIVLEICNALDYKFTQNKRTDELISIITEKLNRSCSVLVFDEIDKIQELDILYNLVENLFRKTIILITNEQNWLFRLDSRLRSRLIPDQLEFKPYTLEETKEILKQRVNYSLNPNAMPTKEIEKIAETTFKLKDIRSGLFLLKESTEIAENSSSKTIDSSHVEKAIEKIENFQKPVELDNDEKKILELIKLNPEKTTGDLFEIYRKNNGIKSKRTFQRKLSNLEKSRLISTENVENMQGKTSKIKPLTDF
jgi:archaeal cell division control protein 6